MAEFHFLPSLLSLKSLQYGACTYVHRGNPVP